MKNTWDDPDGPLWDEDSPEAVWDFDPAERKGKKMTNLQIDDVLGFGALLRAAANQHKAKMVANDYDPTAKIASTATDGTALGEAKALAKATQIEATRLVGVAEGLKQGHYETLSSWCDTMAGAVGKAILAIRTNLTGRGPNPPPAPPAPPHP